MKMKCPHCGVSGSVSDSLVGKKAKCPKCKEVFRVAAEKAPPSPKKEPVMERAGQITDAKHAPGMTAQDEAALEEEIAKIFDDMKNSAMDNIQDPAPDTRSSDEGFGNRVMSPGMAMKGNKYDASDADSESISEEDLKSELEEMLGKKCSVCGTFVGQATKHEIGGNVYCSVCLPEEGGTGSKSPVGKDLVSMGPDLKKALQGYWKSKGMKLAGIVVIAVIIVAVFYILFLK